MSGDEKTTRERIVLTCGQYKRILKKWDNAIMKTEGRKPDKNDLKQAPDEIQKIYKKYYKLLAYLKRTASRSHQGKSSGKEKGLTPKKIFDGIRSTCRENNAKTKQKPSTSSDSKSRNETDSRLIRQPPLTTADKNKSALGYNRFSAKINNVINILSKESQESQNKAHRIIQVVEEDSKKEVTRKALIPNRFAKNLDSSNQDADTAKSNGDEGVCVATNGLFDSRGNSSFIALLDANESGPTPSAKFPTRLNSVSAAVWQNLSPNPKSKNRKSEKLKHVDSGWLSRCGMELDEDSERNDVCISSLGEPDEADDCSELSNKNEGLFSQGFQRLLLSASSESKVPEVESMNVEIEVIEVSELPQESQHQHTLPFESESADSGIVAPAFTEGSHDISNVFDFEAAPCYFTSVGQKENPMFHNDNACPPHEFYLETIDTTAISDITSNPFSYTSSSPSSPACSSKKRPAFVAFSPSPKKPEPPRKFFKSDRSRKKVVAYTVNSYKPVTPVKKPTARPLATTVASKSSETVDTVRVLPLMPARVENSNEQPLTTKRDVDSTVISNASSPPSANPSAKKSKSRVSKTKTTRTTPKAEKKVTRKPRVNKSKASSLLKNEASNNNQNPDTIAGPSTSSYNQNTASEYFNEGASAPTGRKGTRKARLTNKEALQRKVTTGKLNENFVRIDITKKVFVRGRKRISGAKVKRNDWKMKKASASREDKIKNFTCHKCGEAGHFSKFCMKDSLQKEEPDEVDNSPFPTIEEVARMVKGQKFGVNSKRVNVYGSTESKAENQDNLPSYSQLPEDSAKIDLKSTDTEFQINNDSTQDTSPITLKVKTVPPYFGFETGSILCSQGEEETILKDTLKLFGYDEFRGGQLEAISRILKGLSTLVILSTGSGKSLCYQLPAYLYAKKNPGALAICVSPLVSLMEDQVQGMPPFLEAACLHSNMLSSQKDKVLERIRSKKLHVLLVSPEAVCGGLYGLLKGGDMPCISFACIDEVHCVSQWSHNFRPTYLQISKILREKMNVSTILGLTATATESTSISVCEHLQVDPSTTIRGEIVPCNLNLSVSRDTYREEGLLALLRGERFRECESIIIYCTRREECQRIASLIRTNMQDVPGFNGITKTNMRQRVSNNCEAYHAGMTAGRRRLVQQQFMCGKIRIVVATVAFGMGIDKSDIRSVIHYNMPKTFESYVQEIGRAGRDGLPAHCHLFLDNVKGRDLSELRRHVYSNSVDRPTLRKLLRKVFQPCKCKRIAKLCNAVSEVPQSETTQNSNRCPGHEVSFTIDDSVTELDLPQENIMTLLCYLELDKSKKWIEILSHTYQTCKIQSYGGTKLLKSAALKCPALAAAIALKKEKRKFKETDTFLEFNVIEVAATLNWNSGNVKRELKNLEWSATDFDEQGNSKTFRKSGILVEFCDLAFHLKSPGDLTDEEADTVLNYLHKHNVNQEKSQLYQLSRVYQALLSISVPNVDSASNTFDEDKSGMLKNFIYDYFTQNTLGFPADWKNDTSQDEGKREDIRRDVRDLLSNHSDEQFTGRAIAKIFQGIPSPCFPSEIWGRNRGFWRRHLEVDFNFVCQIAGEEILRLQ